MDASVRSQILDFIRRDFGDGLMGGCADEGELYKLISASNDDARERLLQLLREAQDDRCSKSVELVLYMFARLGEKDAIPVEALNSLLGVDWHDRHEEIASILQQRRDPTSVESLFLAAMAEHPYIAVDNGLALRRKCVWALADIGTPEARERLVEIAAGTDVTVATWARKRLDRWSAELPRKGA